MRSCGAKCCADAVPDSPLSESLAIKTNGTDVGGKKHRYQRLTDKAWGSVRQCNKSKITRVTCGRERRQNGGLGHGCKTELKPDNSGSHRYFFTHFACGTTEVNLCMTVHVFDAVLALVMHNRNEEGFETKFGCKQKLNSCPSLKVSVTGYILFQTHPDQKIFA